MQSYEIRYKKLRKFMEDRAIDAVYISSPENYLYMSGYKNPDGFMIVLQNSAYAFADFRYIEAAREKSYSLCTVLESEKYSLTDIIHDEKISTMAIEDLHITLKDYSKIEKVAASLNCRTVNIGDFFVRMRATKTPDEVKNIIAAQRIAERAFEHLIGMIRPDMTEIEVAAELEYYMKKCGSENPSFDTIAVSGKASSVPHGTPEARPLERGFLTLDFGAQINSYHSDMTRTVVVGKATAEERRIYNTVLKAQNAALEYIREGVSNASVDKTSRDIINSAGYDGCFGHSLGHGVGLQIHELPNLSPKSKDEVIVCGNVVTIEPGIYVEGKCGCRIEDMVYISESGVQNLTNCNKEIIEI